ncbi:MAG: BamA/TamA family outer membrane protein [Elainellaceae cyanobacterium]
MGTVATGWYCAGCVLIGSWVSMAGAIALPNENVTAWENAQSDPDTILPYPDPESIPLYPDPEPIPVYPVVESEPELAELDAEFPPIPYYSETQSSSEDQDMGAGAESQSPPSVTVLPPPARTAETAAQPMPSSITQPSVNIPPIPNAVEDSVLLYPELESDRPVSVNSARNADPILPYPETSTIQVVPALDSSTTNSETLNSGSANAVVDLQILGVDADLQQIAREVIRLQPGAIATSDQLQADVAALENSGYFASASASTTSQPNGVVVVYELEPLVVRSLQLLGAQALPPEVFDRAVEPQDNQPISLQLLTEAADQINAWYFDNGYTLSGVTKWLTEPDGTVIFEVTEPIVRNLAIEFAEAGRTVDDTGEPIEGRTREDFIRRELRTEEGNVFNQNDVVEDLETLNRLGVFQQASVAVDVDDAVDPPAVDVTYQVEEGFSRRVQVGGGISTELGLFGSINYSDRNFRGVGEELSLGVQAGGRGLEFNTGFASPYRDSQPNRLGYRINGFRSNYQSLTFSDEVELENGDDAREQRFGGGASVMRPLGEWDAELGLDYSRVSIRDDDGDVANRDEFGNQLTVSDSGLDDLLLLGFSVTQDRRVNSFNPSGGSILRLSTEQSVPVGNGSILMNRLRANYAQYIPTDVLGSGSVQNPEVFAFNLQGGTVLGELPPYEAFDLGGMNSVRGYEGGGVGSGRSYILASAEYRFPIFSIVGGVLFADVASDLGTGSSVEGDPAGVRDKPGTGLGYGFGIRVGSPLGLIRADLGLNDQGDSRIHFGFGQRF